MNQDPVSVSGSKLKIIMKLKYCIRIRWIRIRNSHTDMYLFADPDALTRWVSTGTYSVSPHPDSMNLDQIHLYRYVPIYWSRCTDVVSSVADPGSGIWCLFDPWIRDPEWVFSGSRISDPGSRIPTPYFEELFDNYFGKNFYNSLKIGPNFFL